MTDNEPMNIQPSKPKTKEELIEVYVEKIALELESYAADIDELVEGAYELGWEDGHDTAVTEVRDEENVTSLPIADADDARIDEAYRLGWADGHEDGVPERRRRETVVSGTTNHPEANPKRAEL